MQCALLKNEKNLSVQTNIVSCDIKKIQDQLTEDDLRFKVRKYIDSDELPSQSSPLK